MIEELEAEIQGLIDELHYDKARALYATLNGGKRLRAKLVMMIAANHPDALRLAAIIELIHAASLLHDDVIDEAMTRRGVVSVNATEGSKTAVMLGDILYSKAYSKLTELNPKIANIVSSSVTELSIGEMMDVEMSETFNDDEAKYMQMLYLKTATLIEATAKSAAILAGLDEQKYALYGKNLGLAFQIIDDILDIVSDEATLGKPALNDFKEGKCTLPYIYLYQVLDDDAKKRLITLHKQACSAEDSQWIKDAMQQHQTVQKSYALAATLSQEAKSQVEDEALHAVLDTLMKRSF